MALVVTLDRLRSDSLLWADARPGGANEFVGTNDLDRLINLKIAEWQDLIIAGRPPDLPTLHNYIVATPNIPSLVFAGNLALYSIVTLEVLWNGTDIGNSTRVEPVSAISWADAHKLKHVTWGEGSPKGYIRGDGTNSDSITIYPTPTIASRFFFRYIPGLIDLVPSPGPGHTMVTYNQWDKFITIGVAIEILAIMGRDSSHLQNLYGEQRKRLEALAAERLMTDPKRVRDVAPESPWRSSHWWPGGLPPP